MELIKTIEESDSWISDLLCLSDSAISHALVACAELCSPYVRCPNIQALLPSIRRWRDFASTSNARNVASELLRYIFNTGLYSVGGSQFLELPTSRWPIVLNETAQSFAEDCVLYAANAIATIECRSFFGSAQRCLEYAERCYDLSGEGSIDSLKYWVVQQLESFHTVG
jgi:hypothetical protein